MKRALKWLTRGIAILLVIVIVSSVHQYFKVWRHGWQAVGNAAAIGEAVDIGERRESWPTWSTRHSWEVDVRQINGSDCIRVARSLYFDGEHQKSDVPALAEEVALYSESELWDVTRSSHRMNTQS